jgi:hypothetical protein
MALPQCVYAQKDEYNPVETGVVSLGIAPDARAAAMGDLGAATDPDAYSQFWNPSKYAFAYSNAAVSISYTPWLRKIVNDIFLADIAGYWKLGGGDNQAVSASLRYFSLGEVSTYSGSDGYAGQTFNPYEMAFDLGYSRKLSESYSMGIVFRYVYSALGYNSDGGSDAGDPVSGASAFAADISGYLTKYPIIGQSECQWSFGWNISNIGSKLNFDNGTSPAFLPTNLRLGTNFTFPLADYHTLSIGFDANKLLVPTKPRLADYEDEVEYQQATIDWENTSSISGIFKSFSDAPGGAKEELQEITWSLGAEYSYNNQFFLRAGYYYENEYKGGRKYYGLGAGFALNVLRLDASYMIAASQNSPLDQTLRFSLTFDMDGLKEIFGGRR